MNELNKFTQSLQPFLLSTGFCIEDNMLKNDNIFVKRSIYMYEDTIDNVIKQTANYSSYDFGKQDYMILKDFYDKRCSTA